MTDQQLQPRQQGNCPLSTKEWIVVLNSEINTLKYPDLLPFMSFILVNVIFLITFTVNTSLAYSNCIASNSSNPNCKLAASLTFLSINLYPIMSIILGIVMAVGFGAFLIEYFKIDKKVKAYKYLREDIIHGETDSNKIRKEWGKINMTNLNIKNYLTFDKIIVVMLIALALLVISALPDYFIQGQERNYSIQTFLVAVISALVTIMLVGLTAGYVKSTKEMLDEQVKARKMAFVEKKLENIYSPMNIAYNEFRLKLDSLPNDRIPDNYCSEFIALNDAILKVSNKYYHLLTLEMLNYYSIELWKAWEQFLHARTLENYIILNSRINMFNDLSTREMKSEQELLNSLQNS